MKSTPFLLLLLTLMSCKDGNGHPNYFLTKLLVLLVIVPISFAVRHFRENRSNKSYEIITSNEEGNTQSLAVDTQAVLEEQVEPIIPTDSAIYFHLKTDFAKFFLLALLPPIIFCAINPAFGLVGFFIFSILAFVLYNAESNRLNRYYKKIELRPNRLVFFRSDFSEAEELYFSDVRKVTTHDGYETGAYGVQNRVGRELTFWGDDDKIWTTIDYSKYEDGDRLKEIIFKRLKLRQN